MLHIIESEPTDGPHRGSQLAHPSPFYFFNSRLWHRRFALSRGSSKFGIKNVYMYKLNINISYTRGCPVAVSVHEGNVAHDGQALCTARYATSSP